MRSVNRFYWEHMNYATFKYDWLPGNSGPVSRKIRVLIFQTITVDNCDLNK